MRRRSSLPRRSRKGSARPVRLRMAVAPSATIRRGRTEAISCSSHQRQAAISRGVGLLVDAALAARLELEMLHRVGDVGAARSMPAPRQRVGRAAGRPGRRRARPQGPPASPGCSPTNISRASAGPSPGTTCVAWRHRSQRGRPCSAAAQPRQGRRRLARRRRCFDRRAGAPAMRAVRRRRLRIIAAWRGARRRPRAAARSARPRAGCASISSASPRCIAVELEPRRIEDGGVVGPPQRPPSRRRPGASRASAPAAEAQRRRRPSAREPVGVRIDQRMSAKRRTKKGAVARDDVMLGLEPGDEAPRRRPARRLRGSARRPSSCACRAAPPCAIVRARATTSAIGGASTAAAARPAAAHSSR